MTFIYILSLILVIDAHDNGSETLFLNIKTEFPTVAACVAAAQNIHGVHGGNGRTIHRISCTRESKFND